MVGNTSGPAADCSNPVAEEAHNPAAGGSSLVRPARNSRGRRLGVAARWAGRRRSYCMLALGRTAVDWSKEESIFELHKWWAFCDF